MWKVVISSNLNPPPKLFFYSPVLANNNLLLKIYCENIVVAFLNIKYHTFESKKKPHDYIKNNNNKTKG